MSVSQPIDMNELNDVHDMKRPNTGQGVYAVTRSARARIKRQPQAVGQSMRRWLLACFGSLGLMLTLVPQAWGYGVYDLRQIISNTKPAAPTPGKKGEKAKAGSGLQNARESTSGVDLEYLDQVLNDLARQALYYPPVFSDDAERARATSDVQVLMKMLRPLTSRKYPPSAALLRSGLLHLLAWNLDLPGAEAIAFNHLELYLKRTPGDAYANFLLGVCYAGSANQQAAAIGYLNRAVAGGVPQAHYTLALVYYTQGDRQRALENLQLYQQAFPDDPDIAPLIRAIQNGEVQVEHEQ